MPPGVVLAVVAGLCYLALAAFAHPVGDYFTETDFFGSYAGGALAMQSGHVDPSRYGIIGPGYEFAVALVAFAIHDVFMAAKVTSVLAAVASLLALERLLRLRLNDVAATFGVLLVAVNPVFTRYAHAATADASAAALGILAIAALLAVRRRTVFASGVLVAAATLTRYNLVALAPAAWLVLLALQRPAGTSRARSVILWTAGFALLVAPWWGYSLAHGAVPGAGLVRNAAFFSTQDASRNVQDRPAMGTAMGPTAGARPGVRDLVVLVQSSVAQVPEHVRRDAVELLGWPVVALAVAGAAFALGDATRRRALAPLTWSGAALWAALLPVFYSDRYGLAYLPYWIAPAACGATMGWSAGSRRVPAGAIAALLVAAFSARASVRAMREWYDQLPFEVRPVAAALARDSAPGARVLARKAHVAFLAHRTPVAFPRLGTLPELAEWCRAQRVDYLYYSWYEGELRPEFWYLLDTSGVVPGLRLMRFESYHPAALYRIESGFGRAPDWFANDTLRRVHTARAIALAVPDAEAWGAHLVLGAWALQNGDATTAIRELETVTRVRPDEPTARRLLEMAYAARRR